jgi:hypothetical protein
MSSKVNKAQTSLLKHLEDEEIDSLIDFKHSDEFKALKSLMKVIRQAAETDVLRCNVGYGDPETEKHRLVVARARLRGFQDFESVLTQQLTARPDKEE